MDVPFLWPHSVSRLYGDQAEGGLFVSGLSRDEQLEKLSLAARSTLWAVEQLLGTPRLQLNPTLPWNGSLGCHAWRSVWWWSWVIALFEFEFFLNTADCNAKSNVFSGQTRCRSPKLALLFPNHHYYMILKVMAVLMMKRWSWQMCFNEFAWICCLQ